MSTDLSGSSACTFGRWISALSYETLPPEALTKARQGLLDTIGVALAGSQHEATSRVGSLVGDLAGQPQATILGTSTRTSMPLAAFHNAYAAHVLDFDDTHFDAIVHVNAPVTAAGLAVGEFVGASGRELTAAHVAGLEVTSRVAIAAVAQKDYGWHITGTAGAFGAAATAARLLGLDASRTTHALGIVSTLASGLRGHRGTMTKALNPANAAMNGVIAAFAARRGLTASPAILDDSKVGFFVTHGAPAATRLADGLGERFHMLDWDPKPYPCGVVIHPAVDAALDVLGQDVEPDRIESVELRVNPLALSITGNAAPTDGLESKFSVFHATATALLTGTLLPRHFEDDWVASPEVVRMRSRLTGIAVESTPRDEAEVVVQLVDGRTARATAKARGTRGRRITHADVERKFLLLSEPVLGSSGARSVADAVTAIDSHDVAELVRRCTTEVA